VPEIPKEEDENKASIRPFAFKLYIAIAMPEGYSIIYQWVN
jgi:hypothetical protein